MSLRNEFHSNYRTNFFERVWQFPPRQFERCFTILLCSRRSWAGTRRISHGPATRHQQPLRPSLQLGRDRRGPGRNVDRRGSLLCAADGRLSFSLLNNMLCHQYRGYTIGVECKGSIWLITASPKTADLPILHCYCSKATAQSETDAIAEAKYRVDRVLAAPLSTS